MKQTRREFLKKVAYSAPVVASLGMLVEPTNAKAGIMDDHRMNSKNTKSKIKKACRPH